MKRVPFDPVRVAYGVIRRTRNAGLAIILGISAAAAEPVTIAALGDSLTQGFGLTPDDGFVPNLATWLEAEGAEVELINAGVSGDTTAGGLSRIEWTLTPDVDALIVALGGNDLLRGIDPAASRANLEGILKVASERALPVLLVGMEAPSNFGAEYKEDFDGMYVDLSETYDTIFYENFLKVLAEQEDRSAAIEAYFQGDRIHPNAAGVDLIVADMGPSVLELIGRASE